MSTDLMNAFTPADEIQDIDRFAGRADAVEHAALALASKGTHLVIYGPRGVGKSSLARVVERIGQNDPGARDRFQFLKDYEFDYLPVTVVVDKSVTNMDDILLRFLADERCLADWIPMNIQTKETLYKATGKVNFAVFSGEGAVIGRKLKRSQKYHRLYKQSSLIPCKNLNDQELSEEVLS